MRICQRKDCPWETIYGIYGAAIYRAAAEDDGDPRFAHVMPLKEEAQ